MTQRHFTLHRPTLLLAGLAAATLLSACAPLLVGGAVVGTSMVVTDRRTSGTQLEDQSIELKAKTRVREAVGERGHVNITSYNLQVLITGEVPTEQDKVLVQQIVSRVENVRSIVNEIGVVNTPPLSERTNDSLITGKVKAALIREKDLSAMDVNVETQNGTVQLSGFVDTKDQQDRAEKVAKSVTGVKEVKNDLRLKTGS